MLRRAHAVTSENATVTTALNEDLVARDYPRRFVRRGAAKALASRSGQVSTTAVNEVQRCRRHGQDCHGMSSATYRTRSTTLGAGHPALGLVARAKEGLKLDQYRLVAPISRWPDAAASVREGLDGFHRESAGLPASLRTCLTTTNIIDSTHSGIRQRTRRVTNWKNGEMALRWSAVAFVETEKNYRGSSISGC